MNCPIRNHVQTCPCFRCQRDNPTDRPWIRITESDLSCGECGFAMSEDKWAEMEDVYFTLESVE